MCTCVYASKFRGVYWESSLMNLTRVDEDEGDREWEKEGTGSQLLSCKPSPLFILYAPGLVLLTLFIFQNDLEAGHVAHFLNHWNSQPELFFFLFFRCAAPTMSPTGAAVNFTSQTV